MFSSYCGPLIKLMNLKNYSHLAIQLMEWWLTTQADWWSGSKPTTSKRMSDFTVDYLHNFTLSYSYASTATPSILTSPPSQLPYTYPIALPTAVQLHKARKCNSKRSERGLSILNKKIILIFSLQINLSSKIDN